MRKSLELWPADTVHAAPSQNQQHFPQQVTACLSDEVSSIQETCALLRLSNAVRQSPRWFVIQTRDPGFQFDVNLLQEVEHIEELRCMEFSDDINYIAVTFRRIVQIFSTTTGEQLLTLADGSEESEYRRAIKYICWRSDGMSILTATYNGLIQIWDIWERHMKNHLELKKDVSALSVSSDGKLLAISSGSNIEIYDTEQNKIVQRFRTLGKVVPDSISIRDEQLICGASDGTIMTGSLSLSTYTDTNDGNTMAVEEGRDMDIICHPFMKIIYEKAWSPDYERLLTSSWGGCIELWSIKDEQPQFVLCYQDFTFEGWRNNLLYSVTNLSCPYRPRGN